MKNLIIPSNLGYEDFVIKPGESVMMTIWGVAGGPDIIEYTKRGTVVIKSKFFNKIFKEYETAQAFLDDYKFYKVNLVTEKDLNHYTEKNDIGTFFDIKLEKMAHR